MIKAIDQELCTGCANCDDACPMDVIYMNPETEKAEITYGQAHDKSADKKFFLPQHNSLLIRDFNRARENRTSNLLTSKPRLLDGLVAAGTGVTGASSMVFGDGQVSTGMAHQAIITPLQGVRYCRRHGRWRRGRCGCRRWRWWRRRCWSWSRCRGGRWLGTGCQQGYCNQR